MIDRTGLAIGQEIELRWISAIGENRTLPCRLGAASRGEFAIRLDQAPADELPEVGQDVTIRAAIEYGLWVIPGRITQTDGAGAFSVKVTSPPERLQRRRHERLSMDRRPCLAVLLDDEHKPKARLPARLIDLSAGGAQIECSTQVQRGDLVLLVLELDGGQPIHAVLSIIAAQDADGEPSAGEADAVHHVRGSFAFIKDEDRHRIFRYVLDRQYQRKSARASGRPALESTFDPRTVDFSGQDLADGQHEPARGRRAAIG